jgi:hypothetical protein
MLAEAMKIAGQIRQAASQMGVGDLGEAKFGHVIPPAGSSLYL